jgi:hypothetical protein
MNEKYDNGSEYHNLRTRRPGDYSHLHTMLKSTMVTQYSMKKGIKVFGPPGIDAMLKELKQMHDHKVIDPKMGTMLSKEDKRAWLHYLMFLKKNCTGIIKRVC